MTDIVRDLIDILRVDGERWAGLATLDGALLRRTPSPGEWSALECLGHAADTEAAIFTARIQGILDGVAVLPAFDPDREGTVITEATDPRALAATLAERRARSLEVVASVRDEDLEKTSRHSELGVVTLRELLNEWAAHDVMHIVQAERAVMQAFIPATGPWRHYFVDHDVSETSQEPAAI